jgi:intein/homing endonuclease
MINDVLVSGELIKSINMLELIDLYESGSDIKILSKNIDTKELEFKNIEKAWKTKKDAEMYEIEDVDSEYKIKCTGDHLIYTKNRGWVEAQNLDEKDELDILK